MEIRQRRMDLLSDGCKNKEGRHNIMKYEKPELEEIFFSWTDTILTSGMNIDDPSDPFNSGGNDEFD